MNPKLNDAKRRIYRRAVITIRHPATRGMVEMAPNKAFLRRPAERIGFVSRDAGLVVFLRLGSAPS